MQGVRARWLARHAHARCLLGEPFLAEIGGAYEMRERLDEHTRSLS